MNDDIIVILKEVIKLLDITHQTCKTFDQKLQKIVERVEKIEGYDNLEQFRMTSDDTAHIGPWTTVRACIDCGVSITGGPTRCLYCVGKLQG